MSKINLKKIGTDNQKHDLLTYLKENKSRGITSLEATNIFKIMRLSERIRELESAGVKIERIIETRQGRRRKVRYTRYRLAS